MKVSPFDSNIVISIMKESSRLPWKVWRFSDI